MTTEAEARRQLEERRRLIDAKLRSLHEQEYLLRMEERRIDYQLAGTPRRKEGER